MIVFGFWFLVLFDFCSKSLVDSYFKDSIIKEVEFSQLIRFNTFLFYHHKMGKMRFGKPKETLKVAARDQGLRANNKVKVKGNRKPSLSESLKYLETGDDDDFDLGFGGSMFDDSKVNQLARSGGKIGMKKKTKGKPKRKKRLSFSSDEEEEDEMGGGGFRRSSGGRSRRPMAAPMSRPPSVSSEDDDDSEGFSDDDLDGFSDLSSGEEEQMSFSSGSSSGRSRPHIPLDDSMSIISGGSGSGGKKNDSDRNMFRGMSKEEAEEAEKSDLLARFHFLKQRGVHLSKNYTPKSSLNEMRMEMGRIEHEEQMARAVTINRRWFLTGASLLSKATDRYGPSLTRGRWHGFDKYVLNSINDYDQPFERLSEHYGGVVSAMTGGNPLWEIIVLFTYQFVMYGFVSGGADQARANEEMSSEEIKRRYPNIIQEAVEMELNRRKEEEEANLRQAQFDQRAAYAAFDRDQASAQQYAAPPPRNTIRPPSMDFTRFYDQMPQPTPAPAPPVPVQAPVPPPPPPPPPSPMVEPVLNSESNGPSFPDPNEPQQQHPQFQQQAAAFVINAPADPYMFAEMHAALNQIDALPQQQHHNNIEILEEGMQEETKGDLDNFDTPVATREGRPKELNKAPPNKRDLLFSESMNEKNNNNGNADDGQFVINIK